MDFDNLYFLAQESTVIVGGDKAASGLEGNGSVQSGAQGNTQINTEVGTSNNAPLQEDPGVGGINWFSIIGLYGAMAVALYFFMFRPQRKREKAAKTMQESLRTGDNIVTSSGFYGKIVGTGEDSFLVEFGENRGVRVWIRKSDIAGVKSPVTTPPPIKDEIVDKK